MEYWQKVTVGTFFGVIGTFIFYYCFGKLFDGCYTKTNKKDKSQTLPIPERFRSKKSRLSKIQNAELERFIYEEFESPRQECIVVVGCNGSKAVGICSFLQETKIEFFVEEFPECCQKHLNSNQNEEASKTTNVAKLNLSSFEASQRSALTAISAWAPKWEFADSVNFLSPNQEFVLKANDAETHTSKFVRQFEDKFEFRLYIQWTDNFICDNCANEEMWEGMIDVMKKLLSADDDYHKAWTDFVCEEWPRTKIHVNGTNFHQLPHPGHVTEVKVEEEKLVEF